MEYRSTYTQEMLDDYKEAKYEYEGKMYTDYECKQMMRYQERRIRETKRTLSGLNAGIEGATSDSLKKQLKDEFEKKSVLLKSQEAKLKDICYKTGRRYESARTQVHAVISKGKIVGFNKSVSQKAVWRNKNYIAKYSGYRYNKDGTIKVTDDWTQRGKVSIPKKYKPNAVLDTKTVYKNGYEQIDRTYYDDNAMMKKQIHSGHHNKPHTHQFGQNNEPFHAHDVVWDESGKRIDISAREWNDEERISNDDLLSRKE